MSEAPKTLAEVHATPMELDHSPSIGAIAAALAKAQGVVHAAAKSTINPHFKSKYADLASVWDVIREPLSVNGLAVVQMPSNVPGGVVITTMLLHTSGEFLRSRLIIPVSKPDAQGYGSAITYGRRYSLSAMVGVAADEDDDGNAASERPYFQQPMGEKRAPTQTAALKAKLAEKTQGRMQIQDEPPPPSDADAPPHDAGTGEVFEPDPSEVAIPFGRAKGQPISTATDKDLEFLQKYASDAVSNPDKARFKEDNEKLLRAVRAEQRKRQ
jgi:hypothetical protein